jgi:hypothetical protein
MVHLDPALKCRLSKTKSRWDYDVPPSPGAGEGLGVRAVVLSPGKSRPTLACAHFEIEPYAFTAAFDGTSVRQDACRDSLPRSTSL